MKGWINIKKSFLINEDIVAKEVRLLDKDGEKIGVISLKEALKKAEEVSLDLVQIAADANPPVCRIVDYKKFEYEQKKREKENKKNQKIIQVKEMQFSPNISENDFLTKQKQIIKFLEKENKVKCIVKFKGRQNSHKEFGDKILDKVQQATSEIAVVEGNKKQEGNQMILILSPKKIS